MTQKALDGHMLFLSGGTRNLCEYCGKEYISKTALHRHLKDKHPHEEEEKKEEVDLE